MYILILIIYHVRAFILCRDVVYDVAVPDRLCQLKGTLCPTKGQMKLRQGALNLNLEHAAEWNDLAYYIIYICVCVCIPL
jgi:hypothetical protein